MGNKGNAGDRRSKGQLSSILIVAGLCLCFYVLGIWQRSGFGKGDSIALEIMKKADCNSLPHLNVETHHGHETKPLDDFKVKEIPPCDDRFIDYTPCQDQARAMTFPRENMNYRERHCPPDKEKLHCLIPAPKGYVTPFLWPKSRDFVPYANAPYKSLTVEKAIQNWIQYEGNVFRFPGGGTQFPQGADAYIEQLAGVIPIDNGTVRTALDTGCGVASWGAYLFKKNVIAMSFAPRDSHEAQVQFALERGVPAVIGVLGTIKMPYPSMAFDMAHCSRCLIPWGGNGGMYMMEVDRVLRPGGYWILSGPPINWRTHFKAWLRPQNQLEEEQRKIEDVAKLLCWEKISEKEDIAVWRKPVNKQNCIGQDSRAPMCKTNNANDVWYKKMEACITPYPETTNSMEVKPFPERLNAIPPIIARGAIHGVSVDSFQEDNKAWQNHVKAYKRFNKLIDSGRYRNIMDMNAGLGSFAAAIQSHKLWVMNVMPTIAEKDTLGVVFERGLIGIYHDWCEAFSTYPRTYDLIHANGLFSLYKDKCNAEDILIEMDRILRPEGAVIIRDQEHVLNNVKRIVDNMRWNTKMVDNEGGPLIPEKILLAVKRYWVAGEKTLPPQSFVQPLNPNYNYMDGEDMYSDLRVASFSFYLDSAEESFVPKITEGIPVSSSTVISPEDSPHSYDLERSNKGEPDEVSIFGTHKDFSNKNEVCMRCCTIFACEGTCLEKKADYINGSADCGVHGMVQSQPELKNVEQFSFPVLNSRIENLEVKKHVNAAEIALQGDMWNAVEMFGSGMTKEEDIAVNLARKFSRLTWDAIPNTQSRSLIPASSGSSSWCDDTGSDNSSDLFEIESISSTRYSMLSRQEPYALSKAQNFVKAGAADKSLTVSDDDKRNRNYVGDMSSTYRTTKPKDSCRVKSGARWLLGCKSNNAIRVAENTSRISEDAKGGKKYLSTRKRLFSLQPPWK